MEWTIFSSFKDRIHSDPSGLYADLEQAEQSVKRVAQQAAEKYGTERELHYQERVLKQNVGNLEQMLAEIKLD